MLERLKSWLRGDYNSIRYRFMRLPREWLVYFWYRMTGRSWIDFYARRLDGFSTVEDAPAPSERYLAQAQAHLAFLQAKGLKPHHRFLDYGCGVLRLGLLVIPYLKPHNYIGVDISAGRLRRGIMMATERGIQADSYRTLVVSDCSLSVLEGQEFDIIWAKSVLTHMPETDIAELFGALRGRLAAGGVFYFSFDQSDVPKRWNIKDFSYPSERLSSLAEAHGYVFEIDPDWDSIKELDVVASIRVAK